MPPSPSALNDRIGALSAMLKGVLPVAQPAGTRQASAVTLPDSSITASTDSSRLANEVSRVLVPASWLSGLKLILLPRSSPVVSGMSSEAW